MNQLLRGFGLMLILGGAVLLLVGEKLGEPMPVPPVTLMSLGALAFGAGIVLGILGRAGRAVIRRHCPRCARVVASGEVYCTEHFREAIDRIRDSQSA